MDINFKFEEHISNIFMKANRKITVFTMKYRNERALWLIYNDPDSFFDKFLKKIESLKFTVSH